MSATNDQILLTQAESGEYYELCPICKHKLVIVATACEHRFCRNCIREWQLRFNSWHCPLCDTTLDGNEEDSDDEDDHKMDEALAQARTIHLPGLSFSVDSKSVDSHLACRLANGSDLDFSSLGRNSTDRVVVHCHKLIEVAIAALLYQELQRRRRDQHDCLPVRLSCHRLAVDTAETIHGTLRAKEGHTILAHQLYQSLAHAHRQKVPDGRSDSPFTSGGPHLDQAHCLKPAVCRDQAPSRPSWVFDAVVRQASLDWMDENEALFTRDQTKLEAD